MPNITLRQRAFRLLERHQKLDAALRAAQGRRWVDPFEVARIKKLKLMIKDRLAQLAQHAARRHQPA
ncbi:YdcH family protein [Novosphingobium percolationis]|uniref:YdcH family protein n=1 Tax=Novosphingobium percolationis TaxID=2871811 RepID=UPI001CD2AD54|nr:YdcH family protein [Novosphingobium percolationis]